MNELELLYRTEMMRGPLTETNLTGYASSDSGLESEGGCCSCHTVPSSSLIASIDHQHHEAKQDASLDDRFDTVAMILKDFNDRLQAQNERQMKLDNQISELTTYKKNSHVLFTALKNELEGFGPDTTTNSDVDSFYGQQPSMSELAANFIDKHERLEGRFTVRQEAAGIGVRGRKTADHYRGHPRGHSAARHPSPRSHRNSFCGTSNPHRGPSL